MIEHQDLAQSLVYEDRLPVRARAVTSAWEKAHRLVLEADNQAVLHAWEVLGRFGLFEGGERDLDLSPDLLRVEAKVDVLGHLLCFFLRQGLSIPEAVRVRLSAAGMEWAGGVLCPEGGLVLIELFMDPRYPRPLQLVAQSKEGRTWEGEQWTAWHFVDLSERMRESLEGMIFRSHRRQHARAKQRATGE